MRLKRYFTLGLPGLILALVALYPLRTPALLEMEPAQVPDCELPARVTVHWDARKASPKGIALEISELGQQPRLWAKTKARGSEQTGPWLQDGDSITLRDANGRILARRTLTTVPCTPN